jgi:hypothetical protein
MNLFIREETDGRNILNPNREKVGQAYEAAMNLQNIVNMLGRSNSSYVTVNALQIKLFLYVTQVLPILVLSLPKEFVKSRNALRVFNRRLNQYTTKFPLNSIGNEAEKQQDLVDLVQEFGSFLSKLTETTTKVEKIYAIENPQSDLSNMKNMVDNRVEELRAYVKTYGGVYDEDPKEAEFTQLNALRTLAGTFDTNVYSKTATKFVNIYAVCGMNIIQESITAQQMGKSLINVEKTQDEFFRVLVNPKRNSLGGYYKRGTGAIDDSEIEKILFNDEKEDVMVTNEMKYDEFGGAISNPYIKVGGDITVVNQVPVLTDYAPRNPGVTPTEAPIIMTITDGGGRTENVILDNQAVTSTGGNVTTTPINTVAVVDKDTKEVISVAADFGNGIITKPLVDVVTGTDAASVAVDIKGNPIAVVQKDASGNVQTVTVTSASGQTKDVPVVSTKELPAEIKSQAVITASTVLPSGKTVAATVAGRDEAANTTTKVVDDKDFNKNLMYLGGAVGVVLLLKFFVK